MSELTDSQIAAREAITILGGPVRAAQLLQVKGGRHQTIQSWLKNRVPAEYCPLVEQETRALGRPVICERLRPDVKWSALRSTPAVSAQAESA